MASVHALPPESVAIAMLVKKHILLSDTCASVILFGSRARGDAGDESDWDFLVLTQREDIDILANELRKIMRKEVELKYTVAISLIVKNIKVWKDDYAVTNIYESISAEGVLL